MLNEVAADPIDQKRFSVLFGSEASAAARWLSGQTAHTPAVDRLMLYMRLALVGRPPEERANLIKSWGDTVQKEGQACGVADVLAVGSWNPESKRAMKALEPKRRRAKPASVPPRKGNQ